MSRKKNTGRALAAGALLLAAAAAGARPAFAQCVLNGTITQFEPNPPGASRSDGGWWLQWPSVIGFYLHQPPGLSARLLVTEGFGYQIADLSDPRNPVALGYQSFSPSPINYVADGHSSIAAYGVSADGARAGFVLNNEQISPYHTVIGASTGVDWHVTLKGDMQPLAGNGIVLQQLSSRYLAYTSNRSGVYVADVTSLGSLSPNNLPTETIGAPGGVAPVLAGSYLVYEATLAGGQVTGDLDVINVASPGPIGAIRSGLSWFTIPVSAWGWPAGEKPQAFHAAVDPSNSAITWILAEFVDANYHLTGFGLGSVQNSVFTPAPGGSFRPTFGGGETWLMGGSPTLAATGGNLYALMWATRTIPSSRSRLYSVAVSSFGSATPGSFDVDPATYASFTTGYPSPALGGANGALYEYVPSQTRGWVVPLSCVSPNSPPATDLAVQPVPCPGGGGSCPLNANDTVYVGTQLQITPQIASAKPLTDWRFDFDFHPAEDNGASPHIKSADLAPPPSLPSPITLVGPCDPRNGGAPGTGAGCWTSETANGDFAAGAPAGTTKVLSLALEAANVNGYGALKTLPLTWKVPAVRLQNSNILLGGTLASGSDGTPLSTGFKWYFGTSANSLTPSSCNSSTCQPPFGTKGTYYYWLTVPYAGGYTSPDCGNPCTQSLGTFSVTDVSLAFTGIPTTAVAGAAVNVTDASNAATGATVCGAGLEYSFCDASAGACAGTSWQSLGISPLGSGLSAYVSAPSSAGAYWMRIRYSYTTTGSCASPLVATWTPGVSGVSDPTAWPLAVTPRPPTITLFVNGVDPCVGAGGACSGGIPANIGDVVTVWADLGFSHDANPPPTTAWSFGAGASPAGCSGTGCQGTTFTYTAAGSPTVTLSGYPGITDPAATKLMSVAVPPVAASNSTLPSGLCAGSSVTLMASPTIAGASYSWTGTGGFTSTQQNPAFIPAAAGTYTVTRTISGQPSSQSSTTTMILVPPPVPTAGSNAPVCAGQTLSLTAATVAGATYSWTGPNGFASSQQNPSIANATPAATGTYVVTATVNGCSTAASTSATVNALPAAPAAGNDGPLCTGGTLHLTAATIAGATYAWTGPNGFTSSQQNPSIANVMPAAAGTYAVTATVNGCPGPAGTTTAVVNGSPAAITAPYSMCLPNVASGTASVASAGAGATYAWTVTNGTIVSGQGTPTLSFSVSAAGTTTVAVVVTAGGCVTSSSVPIPVAAQCGGLTALTPCRVLDTRNPNGPTGGPAIGPSSGRKFVADGLCGVPAGMSALSTNVTVLSRDALGSIVVYPGDLPSPPGVSTISLGPGQTRANNAILKLAPDGSFWIWNTTTGTVDVILDVNGAFQ